MLLDLRSLFVVFCRSLYCLVPPLLLTIVLSVLLNLYFWGLYSIFSPSVYFCSHCIVLVSLYFQPLYCRSLFLLLAIAIVGPSCTFVAIVLSWSLLSFDHCIVGPSSIYGFWPLYCRSLVFLQCFQTIVLSVPFTFDHCIVGPSLLLCHCVVDPSVYFCSHCIVGPSFTFGHCIVGPSFYFWPLYCRSLVFCVLLQTIVLSVPFTFGHCIVGPSFTFVPLYCRSLVFCVVFWIIALSCCPLYFWPLYCRSLFNLLGHCITRSLCLLLAIVLSWSLLSFSHCIVGPSLLLAIVLSVGVTRSLVFCVVFCRSLLVLSVPFFWPLYCRSLFTL